MAKRKELGEVLYEEDGTLIFDRFDIQMMTIVIRFCWQESLPSFYYCECDASYSLIIANVITISFPNNLATVFPSYMYDIIPSIFFKHIAIDQFQILRNYFFSEAELSSSSCFRNLCTLHLNTGFPLVSSSI
jgi:hypothetical protein